VGNTLDGGINSSVPSTHRENINVQQGRFSDIENHISTGPGPSVVAYLEDDTEQLTA